MAFLLMVTFALCKRSRAFYYSTMMHFACFLTIFFKLYFHGPRPYQHSREIEVYGYSTEYGDPSGHTMSASAIYSTILLEIFASKKAPGLPMKTLLTAISIFLVVMVGFSRVFTGQHSLDQILTGSLLGTWTGFTSHYCFRDIIYRHFEDLANPLVNINYGKYVRYATAIMGFILVSCNVVFEVVERTFTIPAIWI